jgi:hypothetical protein
MSNLTSDAFLIYYDARKLIQLVNNYQPLLNRVAADYRIGSRALRLQVLLHLPRLVSPEAWPSSDTINAEVTRLAQIVADRVEPYRHWLDGPAEEVSTPSSLILEWIPEAIALVFHERFHYLASPRNDSIHFGLTTPEEGRIAAMLTLSSFDLWHLRSVFPEQLTPSRIRVISRVYAHDWAPHNSISFMISKVINWIKRTDTSTASLITYLNPNLGWCFLKSI